MQRSRTPYFFLALAAALAISAIVTLVMKSESAKSPADSSGNLPTTSALPSVASEDPSTGPGPSASVGSTADPAATRVDPTSPTATDPADLVQRIAKALEAGDAATVEKIVGPTVLDSDAVLRLKALAANPPHLRQPNGIREVGELTLNQRSRWAIELDGPPAGLDRIYLDLRRDGHDWRVERITLPPAPGQSAPVAAITDALGIADAFLQAVLHQDFELAKNFVDPKSISDAKIAGLCILFEEGQYQMRKNKPLRAMFERPDACGYLANVETADGKESAQFSLNLRLPPAPGHWLVTEINLDRLLADYARRVAGGDVYFSPFVKNPAGGETLAIYFGFDEDQMNPRTRRQLEIVSSILKADPVKKITLSGHTDALGTDPYNQSLSSRRATTVKEFLIQAGVTAEQIVTIGKGASQPRRPNVTETGADNPEGRRANRRTEIYLDF